MIKIGRSALFAGLLVFLAAMLVRTQAEETEAAAADAPSKAVHVCVHDPSIFEDADGDASSGFAVWAPDYIWNPWYVWEDGSEGACMLYFCTSSTWRRSCIGFLFSQRFHKFC